MYHLLLSGFPLYPFSHVSYIFLFTKLKILIMTIVPRFLGKIGPGYKAIICFTYCKVIKSVIFGEFQVIETCGHVITVKGPLKTSNF